MKKYIVNIICLLISLTVFVVGIMELELLVRKIKPQITFAEAYKINEGFFQRSNHMAFTLKPNLDIGWLKTNSLGYRDNEFKAKKPEGEYRILVLGDSFVLSVGVAGNDNTFPQIMESILNKNNPKKFEVINAGFHDGFSPDSYYSYLINEGLKLEPDMVVMAVYPQNDIGDLKGNRWEQLDDKRLPQKVVSEWRKVDSKGRLFDGIPPLRYRYSRLRESHLWILIANWLDKNWPIFREKEEAEKQKEIQNWYSVIDSNCIFIPNCASKFSGEIEKLVRILKGTNDLLKSRQIPLLVVFEPSKIQLGLFGNPLSNDDILSMQKKITGNFQNDENINFYDLTPEYMKINAIEYYNDYDTHWNLKGNQKTAELIVNKIISLYKNNNYEN